MTLATRVRPPHRTYFPHRRAYGPRIWPWMIAAGLLAGLTSFALGNVPWYLSLAVGITYGVVGGNLAWQRWRRKHPVISPQEWLDDKRRAAPWN